MENQALFAVVERLLDGFDELITNEAITSEIGAVFEVDNRNRSLFIGFDRELIERNNGVVLFADIIIGDKWGGGAEDGFCHLTA